LHSIYTIGIVLEKVVIMEHIILIQGQVKHPITIDPSVWIFDDRKVDLNTYFSGEHKKVNEIEEYTKSVSKHWDREMTEGAIYPPINRSLKKYEKEKALTGTFAMPLKPFLQNAEPLNEASTFIIETSSGESFSFPLQEAFEAILGFSKDGKPLIEDGPVHYYFGDGSNVEKPIKNVINIIIK
jgi:hypothetical protein